MKKVLVILLLLIVGYFGFSQTNSDKVKNTVFKRVILIETVPTEVLMNSNGDILAKLNVLPDYLKKFDTQDSIIDISNVKIEEMPANQNNAVVVADDPVRNEFSTKENSNLEIKFKGGTAFIDPAQLQILNSIIGNLNTGNIQGVKLFGFVNEPDYRSAILSQRRMEAVLAYMKIKGVDIDNKVVVGSSVSALNNKIVFVETK